jgi:hypothetical protein
VSKTASTFEMPYSMAAKRISGGVSIKNEAPAQET